MSELLEGLDNLLMKARLEGIEAEQGRILAMKKDIINCVIDYGLTPEKYERICNDIDALIKGEK